MKDLEGDPSYRWSVGRRAQPIWAFPPRGNYHSCSGMLTKAKGGKAGTGRIHFSLLQLFLWRLPVTGPSKKSAFKDSGLGIWLGSAHPSPASMRGF